MITSSNFGGSNETGPRRISVAVFASLGRTDSNLIMAKRGLDHHVILKPVALVFGGLDNEWL